MAHVLVGIVNDQGFQLGFAILVDVEIFKMLLQQ